MALDLRFRSDLRAPQIESAVARLHTRIKAALAGSTKARLVVIEPSPRVAASGPGPRPDAGPAGDS
jgi:hypothetical protein